MATRPFPAKRGVQHATSPAKSELELYKRIFAEAADAIAIVAPDGTYLEQNAAHEQLTGYTSAELAGNNPAIHLGEETFQQIAAELARSGRFRGEVTSRHKHGVTRPIDLMAFSVTDEKNQVVCFVGIKRDITERKRAEQERIARIRELESVYALIRTLDRASELEHVYEAALDAVLSSAAADRAAILIYDDDDGKMHFKASRGLSPEYRAAVDGHSPWQRHDGNAAPILVPDVMADESLASYRAVIVNEGVFALAFIPIANEGRLLGKFMLYFNQPHEFQVGEVRVAQALAAPVAVAIDRRVAEQALRHSERLATAGRLAATIAHEINNPLEAVTNLAFLARSVCQEPQTVEYLNDLDRELTRVSQITRQTLGFYRDSGSASVADAAAVMLELLHIYEPKMRNKAIEVVTSCEAAPVYAVGGELRQVLTNIISNAIDALPGGGRVSIATRHIGQTSELVVSDNGYGIGAENLERIFEPFFTTKQQVGTGLGLWVTRQLLEKNGGTIVVTSSTAAEDHGTTVRVTLPSNA
jgi:PAS domain S-box-containing protein